MAEYQNTMNAIIQQMVRIIIFYKKRRFMNMELTENLQYIMQSLHLAIEGFIEAKYRESNIKDLEQASNDLKYKFLFEELKKPKVQITQQLNNSKYV